MEPNSQDQNTQQNDGESQTRETAQTSTPTPVSTPQPIQSADPNGSPSQPEQPLTVQQTPPGRVLAIVGLILPFVGLALAGIVLSIIGLVRSRRAGKADVIAIIGLIVNILAIVITVGIFAALVLVAKSNVDTQAITSTRESNASGLASFIEVYSQQTSGNFPSTDPTGFRSVIQPIATGLGDDVFNNVSTSDPDAAHPDRIKLGYCGGSTQNEATGMQVFYWDETKKAESYETAGTGCPMEDSTEQPVVNNN